MLNRNQPLNQLHQMGVGLVEVLVALIIISVGMLGIASMYVTTLSAKSTSLSRTKAVNLAYDMGDRIRANPTGGAGYNLAFGGTPGAVNCKTAACTTANIAASDLNLWRAMVTNQITGLPSGDAQIVYTVAPNSTTPDTYTITLRWQEKGITDPLTFSIPVQICNRTLTPSCRP